MRLPSPWIAGLLASVLVNGALVGFLVHRNADGPSWRGHHEDRGDMERSRDRGPNTSGFDVRAFLDSLPEAEGEIARSRLHDHMETMRGMGREAFEARRQADAVLAADPFDPEAARAALERVREIRLAFESGMEDEVIDIIADLDPDVRTAALEAGRQNAARGRFRREAGPDDRRRGPGSDGPRHEGPPPEGPPPEGPPPEGAPWGPGPDRR